MEIGFFMIGVSRLLQVFAKCLLKIGLGTGSFSSLLNSFLREKRLSPRRASAAGGSLLHLSPRRTRVCLIPLLS